MKYNKLKAFTLAEVMVLLLTLSILLAAFSPVFTTRFSNFSVDDVWSFVPADDENDAYYDTTNKSMTASAFIGMTPSGAGEVPLYSADAAGNTLYSKLLIRPSDKIIMGGLRYPQNQFHFRYGSTFSNPAGSNVGSMFVGYGNFMLGGTYNTITNDAKSNTAYGRNALSDAKDGTGNTAVGFSAMETLKKGSYNTVVGVNAASSLDSNVTGNTVIGNGAATNIDNTSFHHNTIIGHNSGGSSLGYYNTFIGNNIATDSNSSSSHYNVGVGNNSLNKLTSGTYNTAIGYQALGKVTSGSYNTAVGINACQKITSGSYKTCIGAFSGAVQSDAQVDEDSPTNDISSYNNLFTGDHERIFIGSYPRQYVPNEPDSEKAAAILEVHNVTNSNTSYQKSGIANAPDASVVINGNLIVRGQSYIEVPIRRPDTTNVTSANVVKGLTMFTTIDASKGLKLFAGDDGFDRSASSWDGCKRCRNQHKYHDIRQHCICTSVSSSGPDNTKYYVNSSNWPISTSYDWSTMATRNNQSDCRKRNAFGSEYNDASLGKSITIDIHESEGGSRQADHPMAHTIDGKSCCPILKSDKRLKNVGDKFTAGLAELKNLNIYNYTFKADANKTPHVGVIAQDLKTVFPNAVAKNHEGYYEIRWDEMFYALINAVKDINTRVVKLASNITKDQQRITALKKDNANLNAQLDKLADEVVALEAAKHK